MDTESWTNQNSRMWSLGWAKAAQLSGLDLDDPSSRNVPYVDAARDYFYSRVLRQHGSRKTEMRESDGAKSHGAREFQETVSFLLTSADETIRSHTTARCSRILSRARGCSHGGCRWHARRPPRSRIRPGFCQQGHDRFRERDWKGRSRQPKDQRFKSGLRQ